ncbi:hypothetical protein BH09PAT3_BH09PAT3_0640 [soil metagenome]
MPQKTTINSNLMSVIVTLIIVAVIGGTGAYIYKTNHDQSNTIKLDKAAQIDHHAAGNLSQEDSEKTMIFGSVKTEQAKTVQAAYDTYLNTVKPGNADRLSGLQSISTYITPELYQKISDSYADHSEHDEVLCAQDIPSKAIASQESKDDANEIIVMELFGTTMSHVHATVGANNKITAITCAGH